MFYTMIVSQVSQKHYHYQNKNKRTKSYKNKGARSLVEFGYSLLLSQMNPRLFHCNARNLYI